MPFRPPGDPAFYTMTPEKFNPRARPDSRIACASLDGWHQKLVVTYQRPHQP